MIDATDLAMMRAAQLETMLDTCVLLSRSDGLVDAYNRPARVWAESAPIACGLDLRASRELLPGTEVPVYDARLRLPLTATVANIDRVRVTHRYGEALTSPLVFDAIGEPRRGPSALVLDLRTATEE